jgi:hypothetical protein
MHEFNGLVTRKSVVCLLALNFAAVAATQDSLAGKLLSTLDRLVVPEATAAESTLSKQNSIWKALHIEPNRFLVDDGTAYLLNYNKERELAPDGFYKLPEGTLVGVKNGNIISHGTLIAGLPLSFRQSFRQARHDIGRDHVFNGAHDTISTRLSVKEIYARILEE